MTSFKTYHRRIFGGVVGRPMNFSLIDDKVGGSACPMSKKEVEWLRRNGVGAILSLTENPLKEEWLDGIEYKNVKMKDHAVPTLPQLREAVDFVNAQSAANRIVVVHCMAGKGRTGSVLAAYMCQKYGLSPSDAITKLRSQRPGSVERGQAKVVEEFCRSLQSGESDQQTS